MDDKYTVLLFDGNGDEHFTHDVRVVEDEVEDNVEPYAIAKCCGIWCRESPLNESDIESGKLEGNSSKLQINISEYTTEIEVEMVDGTTKKYNKLDFTN